MRSTPSSAARRNFAETAKSTKTKSVSAEDDEMKAQAYKDLAVLRKTAGEHAPSGQATNSGANGLKQAIGDAVNWEQREKPTHNHAIDAYREAYGQFQHSVNGLLGNDGATLNGRVSNVMSARNPLKELTVQDKHRGTPPIEIKKPSQQ
jgi:formylglycine-generating enzyme required for sulfatase activity